KPYEVEAVRSQNVGRVLWRKGRRRVVTGANHPASLHRRSDGGPERRHQRSDGGPERLAKLYTSNPWVASRLCHDPISRRWRGISFWSGEVKSGGGGGS